MIPFYKLKKFRVLVGTPHADRKNYCLDEYMGFVKTLTYKNYDVLVADNSETRANYKKIMRAGLDAVHIKPKRKSNIKYICESHEALRLAAIKGDYDYLLHLESDITAVPDIIERLMVHQKPVVSAPYFIDFGHNSHLMIQDIEPSGSLRHTINIKEGRDFLKMDGKLRQVYAAGLGCCLIHKKVFNEIAFRYVEGEFYHPDTFFAFDLNERGIKQYVDTSLLCTHKNSEWINF